MWTTISGPETFKVTSGSPLASGVHAAPVALVPGVTFGRLSRT